MMSWLSLSFPGARGAVQAPVSPVQSAAAEDGVGRFGIAENSQRL